ncbi:MAG: glycosyltransferase family 2 protein [Pseudomonadota bacterium]
MGALAELLLLYRLRWKRRRFLWRSLRKRRQLNELQNRTNQINTDDILAFATVRNELNRLPYFLEHYRKLGVNHFLFVDNDSDDGGVDFLSSQSDVSLWHTASSYRKSRFGVDWLTWLQMKYAHGHWCLMLDADEILIYPHYDTRPLTALTGWLEQNDRQSFGTIMLDMYPKGPLGAQKYYSGVDPFEQLCWFDAGNYFMQKKPDLHNLWIQGGVRARRFFANQPKRAPTISKTPLVKWNRRYAYVSSTHSLLPRRLNKVYDDHGGECISGILLHSKFLETVVARSSVEKARGEHFANSALYHEYYDALADNPDLWCEYSTRFNGWRQLEAMGLMSKGGWI